MKTTLSVLLMLLASTSFAKGNFTGRCAKAAVEAAVQKWADVPNPDAHLEYMPVSAKPSKKVARSYEVVPAFFDGNDGVYGSYLVSFENLNTCKGTTVKQAR